MQQRWRFFWSGGGKLRRRCRSDAWSYVSTSPFSLPHISFPPYILKHSPKYSWFFPPPHLNNSWLLTTVPSRREKEKEKVAAQHHPPLFSLRRKIQIHQQWLAGNLRQSFLSLQKYILFKNRFSLQIICRICDQDENVDLFCPFSLSSTAPSSPSSSSFIS